MKQRLLEHLQSKHGLTLSENEIKRIINVVLSEDNTNGWTERVEKGETVLCLVWDEMDDGHSLTLAHIAELDDTRSKYITTCGAEYDYAEPAHPAAVLLCQRWSNLIVDSY